MINNALQYFQRVGRAYQPKANLPDCLPDIDDLLNHASSFECPLPEGGRSTNFLILAFGVIVCFVAKFLLDEMDRRIINYYQGVREESIVRRGWWISQIGVEVLNEIL